MTQAMRAGRSSVSKVSTLRPALRPESNCFQPCSTPTPKGETSPMPVMTTRRMSIPARPELRRGRASGGRLVDVLDGVADRQDGLGRIVGDLDAELFLERHHQLDGVQAVRTE